MFTPSGKKAAPTPRTLTTAEVRATVQDFRRAAARAVEAGADGVEIHGANGYLIQQFMAPNANRRSDEYGGAVANRTRFALEVATAVAKEIGPERVGIRLSPGANIGGLDEGPDGSDLYRALVAGLNELDLAYLHLFHFGDEDLLNDLRRIWSGPLLLVRPERTLETMQADVAAGLADALPLGRWALANPDVVDRLRAGVALTEADPATFFSGGAAGYVDYRTMA